MQLPCRRKSELEIWAGIECTVNRVGERFYDQCARSGHLQRTNDLKLIRELGITVLRYPFLWETADWSLFDRRAEEIRRLGIHPIAGLLHHGSGPKHTSLMDPRFPGLFAQYASEFAARYPWITDYTPINEPLTTARFSGLYGVWFPHLKSDEAFLRALLNQTKATILAMKAIRQVNPRARLVQTEDLGRTTGTEALQYQVEFENQRRWLSVDLLCGRVVPEHPLHSYLTNHGVQKEELEWVKNNATPPDIFGINHYLLSNRFLDEELHHYPAPLHGGNGRHAYADVGAVDSVRAMPIPAHAVFQEAWERYQIPIAITEVHASGGRESQLRWFHAILHEAQKAIELGVNLQAITAWSVFGSYDWNSLCTQETDYYESGVFDVRSGQPTPTAIARYIKDYLQKKVPTSEHPLLEQSGWWDRTPPASASPSSGLFIHGKESEIGMALGRACDQRGIETVEDTTRRPWGIIDVDQESDHTLIQARERRARQQKIQFLKVVMERKNEMRGEKLAKAAHIFLDFLIDGKEGWFTFDSGEETSSGLYKLRSKARHLQPSAAGNI